MAHTKTSNYTLLPQGETDPLASSSSQETYSRWNFRYLWKWALPGVLAAAVIIALIISQTTRQNDSDSPSTLPPSDQEPCVQYPSLRVSDDRRKLQNKLKDELSSDKFFEESIKRMQGAVQIPTESFDDLGEVGEDKRWEVFIPWQEYLRETFPLVHSKLDITKVNTYGLLIEWKGADESLKPYLFMGHQDVVPVPKETESRWKYPPYSAHWDGRFIWGRGATDCKNVVIGVLEAFETLLEKDFTPQRTILAAFGFDEEISGFYGAQYLSKHLEDSKGKDSIELVIDEGGLGIKELYGAMFVLPGVGEKGYTDVKITIETAGGHSSVPPDHTGIGILSQVLNALETNPYQPELTPFNPYFTTLQCGAAYGPDMAPSLRKSILKSLSSTKAAKQVANDLSKEDIYNRYLMQTSQAIDLVYGGVKVNALPEKVYAVVNYRIAVEKRVKDVRSKIEDIIASDILSKYSFSLDAWGSVSGNTSTNSVGQIILEDFSPPLEPSPVSPFDTEAYKTFTGTIKQVFGQNYIVAPSLMTGNTDTKFYWNLSKNIYRFSPVRDEGRANAHTVDERIGMKEHVEGVHFYTQIILNGDL